MKRTSFLFTYGLSLLLFWSCDQIKQSFKDTYKEKEEETDSSHLAEVKKNQEKFTPALPRPWIGPDFKKRAPEKKEGLNFLEDSLALERAQQALMDLPRFKGKVLNGFSKMHFYADGRIMLLIQDPDNPKNIDEYSYDEGVWKEPRAMQVSSNYSFQRQLFSLNKVKFRAVHRLFKGMKKKMEDMEEVKPVTHIYYLSGFVDNTKSWNSSVETPRERYSVKGNDAGEIVRFRRY